MTAPVKKQRPEFGRLIWKDDHTGRIEVVRKGHWALLQLEKKRLMADVGWQGGKFYLTYQ